MKRSAADSQPTTKVFISATTGDLGSMREIVKQGLLTLGCLPVEQTNFPPDYRSVSDMLEGRIRECDAMIHLVGLRYGLEPDPATLPAGTQRRSFTQMEADIARRLGLKLFVFLCPEDFPYEAAAPETDDKAQLQRDYREEICRREDLHSCVGNSHEVAQRVRELHLELDQVKERMSRHRRRSAVFAGAFALLLAALAAVVWWNVHRTPDVVKEAVHQSLVSTYDPVRIKENLQNELRKRAAEEIAKLDKAKDWEKIAELERSRDQQLADVDRFLERLAQAFEKKEASATYETASQILSTKGPAEALGFLESKSGARESEIEALKHEMDSQKNALRELLREKLLKASLLEKSLKLDEAEAEYEAVVRDGGAWAEPRNALAWLLEQRGQVQEPVVGNRNLQRAVDLCRGTLALADGGLEPRDLAMTQNQLGNALLVQGQSASGEQSQRLLGEAVTAYRAALEVRTKEHFPLEWASTQNNLGNVLWVQGKRAEGEQSQRLLEEAVTAYRAAFEVFSKEPSPRDVAMTQINLGNVLWVQGERAAGAQSQRLLGEAEGFYRAALEVYSKEPSRQNWALTQNNLGSVLWDEGQRAGGEQSQQLLGKAANAYRAALEVYTKEQAPQNWAMTQSNLGNTLQAQGERAAGEQGQQLLGKAVSAYRAVLEVYSKEQLPQDWGRTQHNLGLALQAQGERAVGEQGQRLLGEAVSAYRAALEVRAKAQFPRSWRMTMVNLKFALIALAKGSKAPDAVRATEEAAQIERELATP